MEKFINADFLLENEYARELYRNFAEKQPIIDFHCHLDPKEIWEDRKWENISQLWLESDHYKWRAMRSNGVEERYCTGDAPDSATRCTTGRIWSLPSTSESTTYCFRATPRSRFGTGAAKCSQTAFQPVSA